MPGDLRIQITIDAEAAIKRMKDMRDRSKDFRPVFRWAKRELGLMNGQNFAQNGLPSGKPWSPLDPQYAAWKATAYPGKPDMVISKKLFHSAQMLNTQNSINMEHQKCRSVNLFMNQKALLHELLCSQQDMLRMVSWVQ